MILTETDTNKLLEQIDGIYSGEFLKRKIGYYFYGSKVSPTGSIVCFEAPTNIGIVNIEKALVFMGELPNVESFGGICFQRLYNAQLGSLFSELFETECYVDNSIIVCNNQQVNISITNKVKDSVIFHNIFSLKTDIENFYIMETSDKLNTFKEKSIELFYQLSHSIFLDSQRDNF